MLPYLNRLRDMIEIPPNMNLVLRVLNTILTFVQHLFTRTGLNGGFGKLKRPYVLNGLLMKMV